MNQQSSQHSELCLLVPRGGVLVLHLSTIFSGLPVCRLVQQDSNLFFCAQKKTDHERGDRSHKATMEATSFSELCRKADSSCEQNLESQFLGLWWQNSSVCAGIYRGCTAENLFWAILLEYGPALPCHALPCPALPCPGETTSICEG